MAALRAFLPLAICLLLGHQTFAQNNGPCQKRRGNGFQKFTDDHILKKPWPKIEDKNGWERHIDTDNNCARTRQSFLDLDVLRRVKDVCALAGRKMNEENLCISDQLFTFVTVIIEEGTCIINNVIEENKHLILGCDIVGEKCLPVHFHGNRKNIIPNNKAQNCQAR